ncbi:MAG: hypothetical protein U0S36_04605 [Candidatus Nanopelagicales bacterium]
MAGVMVPRVRRRWTADDLSLDSGRFTFIQVARGMNFDGTALALVELAPIMPYVTGSPLTCLGHISTGAFLDLWTSDPRPPVDSPSRPSVLSLADPAISPLADSLLLLARPRIHDTGLCYSVTVLSGTLPASSGSCVLYVNATVAEPGAGSSVGVGQERSR